MSAQSSASIFRLLSFGLTGSSWTLRSLLFSTFSAGTARFLTRFRKRSSYCLKSFTICSSQLWDTSVINPHSVRTDSICPEPLVPCFVILALWFFARLGLYLSFTCLLYCRSMNSHNLNLWRERRIVRAARRAWPFQTSCVITCKSGRWGRL